MKNNNGEGDEGNYHDPWYQTHNHTRKKNVTVLIKLALLAY